MVRRLVLLLALLSAAGGLPRAAASADTPVVVVVGTEGNGVRAAADGVRAAATSAAAEIEVQVAADLGAARRASPTAVLVAEENLDPRFWKKAGALRCPVFLLLGRAPDASANDGGVFHLAPSPAAEAVFAADALTAPLSARRVGVIHEDTPWGRDVAAGVARSLSSWIALAGIEPWPEGELEEAARTVLARMRALEADWVHVIVRGARADALARALEAAGRRDACLFADGNRRASLLALAPTALARSVFVGGPDPEMEGRAGEALLVALEGAGRPYDCLTTRAFEATRRTLEAVKSAGSARGRKVLDALREGATTAGVFGLRESDAHGAMRSYPMTLWRVDGDRLLPFPASRAPTAGCGPPLGFGHPPPAPVNDRRGRIGYLTWGEGETRTIDEDLTALGLATGGEDEALDALVRQEILGRAIRIAHRLFRREADGTPIAGWSWGMTFSTSFPDEDVPTKKRWIAVIAGDHPAAGGQVIGDRLVAVYSTFLVRTMYGEHALDPPLAPGDRSYLDGSWRWEDDPSGRLRADRIRCLMDGFASAIGLTLSHEFGHLCGCGHDTEHPTSIMNVVAGAGASWERAVWIPRHQEDLTRTLGLEGLR